MRLPLTACFRLDGRAVGDTGDPAAQDHELGFAAADRDLIVLDVHDLAHDTARGHHLIAALQRREQLLVLLRLAALRPDQQEIEDRDEQPDLNDEGARPRPTRTGGRDQEQG